LLEGVPWQTELLEATDAGAPAADAGAPVPGKGIGTISIPLGAREARPIVVALHGAGDRPEWECGSWRGITSAYPILICPRGHGPETALGWRSPEDTRARIERAVAAAKRMLPGWVRDDVPRVLVGFSMGAVHAASVAAREPMLYRRVTLTESGFAPESSMAFGRPWATGGGERLALLCTTPGCVAPYRAAAANVARHHVPARVNVVGTHSHGMFEEVVRSMRRDWPWLVAGAPGWEAYRPPEEEALPGRTEVFPPR